MRELRFRYFNLASQKMVYPESMSINFQHPWTTDDGDPVMQYTSIDDKRGTRIYTKDIIKWEAPYEPEKFRIGFVVEIAQCKEDSEDEDDTRFINRFSYGICLNQGILTNCWEPWDMEVIGNTFENASLLMLP